MMTIIRGLVALSRPFSLRMTHCELNGALLGAIAGLLFSLVWLAGEEVDPSFVPVAVPLLLQVSLVLAVFCWFALFTLLCGPLRYAPSDVAGPLAINALLTCLLTVFLCNLLGQPLLFFVLGISVGFMVGRVLCWGCRKANVRVNNRRSEG